MKMLPQLIGSEKQVKWGSDIRNEAIDWAEENVNILVSEGLPAPYAQEMRKLIEKAINEKTDAKIWIEGRRIQIGTPPQYQEDITEVLRKEIPPLRAQISPDQYSIVWRVKGLSK
jgi:hypothetical protein